MTRKIIHLIVVIAFLFNDMAFALSPKNVSGAPDHPVRDDMYAFGQKLLATRDYGPATRIRFDEALDGTFRGSTPKVDGLSFVDADYSKPLPAGWENNPIFKETDLVKAFEYFRDSEAKLDPNFLRIEEGYFEVDEAKGELPIARIERYEDGTNTLILHTKYVQMWNDLRTNDIWFVYDFPGVGKRTVSLAWAMFYSIAKHEMADLIQLKGVPKGGGHALHDFIRPGVYKDLLDDNEEGANITGGRYMVVNQALKMWFVGSYCFENKYGAHPTRYNNAMLKKRLEWFFEPATEKDKELKLSDEFPTFRDLPGTRKLGIDIALAVNREYFSRPGIKVPEFTVDEKYLKKWEGRKFLIKDVIPAMGETAAPAMQALKANLDALRADPAGNISAILDSIEALFGIGGRKAIEPYHDLLKYYLTQEHQGFFRDNIFDGLKNTGILTDELEAMKYAADMVHYEWFDSSKISGKSLRGLHYILESKDPAVIATVLPILKDGLLKWQNQNKNRDSAKERMGQIIGSFVLIGEPAIPTLLELAQDSENRTAASYAKHALEKMGETAAPAMQALAQRREIEIVKDLVLHIGRGYGPGWEDLSVPMITDTTVLENLYRTIGLLSPQSKLKVLLSQMSMKQTGPVKATMSAMRRNKGEDSVSCSEFLGKEGLLRILPEAGVEDGFNRVIVVSDDETRKAMAEILEECPERLKNVRIINVEIPSEYETMNENDRSVCQMDAIVRAILARMIEKDGNLFVRATLKAMLEGRIKGDVDTYMNGLVDAKDETPSDIKARVLNNLGVIVSLVEKIALQILILRDFVLCAA